MNANFFRELPDYGGGSEKKRRKEKWGESWGTIGFRRDANTSVTESMSQMGLRASRLRF